jgi:hypothetical protein
MHMSANAIKRSRSGWVGRDLGPIEQRLGLIEQRSA